MSSSTWCCYITQHATTNFYYIGKSSLARISAGYKGSGPRLHCAMLHPGFEPETWTTTVLDTYPTETIAFLAEAKLVPLELLSDPFCLNSVPGGGKRFYGSPYAKLLKLNAVKRPKPDLKRPRVKPRILSVADLMKGQQP